MDSDLANIALICALLGVGVATFIGVIAAYIVVNEFLETWYLED